MLLKSVCILYSRQLKDEQKKWGGYERVGKEITAARKRWREKYESKREREEKTQIKWIVPFKILCCL